MNAYTGSCRVFLNGSYPGPIEPIGNNSEVAHAQKEKTGSKLQLQKNMASPAFS